MRKHIYIFISFVLLLQVVSNEGFSQSLMGKDLKTINIDDLTDEEILSYMRQVESSGYTEQQLEALARQRGMSESQIAKLRRRVEDLRNSLGRSKTGAVEQTASGRKVNIALQNGQFSEGDLELPFKNELSDEEKKIFGFDLFKKENLTFAPNLNIPTPADYVLGPGDEVIIDLWGSTQLYERLEISPEGTIRPNNLSPIHLNGLTIKEAEKKIINRLSQIHSGLLAKAGNPPSIFYQISLGNIRSINISVVGEVHQPGNYVLNSLSTVFTALYASGGPNKQGTFRNIQLVRNNKLVAKVDVYEFLINGIQENNLRLKSGDVIIVRPYQSRVELSGEVKRPGYYETLEGESFSDLLGFAGGFTNTAYKGLITARRNGVKEREVIDVNANSFDTFIPQDGDIYHVTPILDRYKNRVQIDGAVYREGEYELTPGLTLKQLIEKADGLRGDAFMNRATIYRMNEDFSQDVIPIDLGKLMSGNIPDIPLVREDIVSISSIYSLKEEYIVQISGEVLEGGVYPFFKQMTVQDLIVLAGGLTEGASGAMIEISRRNKNPSLNTMAEIITLQIDKSLSLSGEDRNLLLQPFDQVYVRKTPGYTIQQQVTVEGEVIAPGTYSISRKDERISDILKRAQGLTTYAYPEGAILIRKTEFSSSKSNDQISQEHLQQLRAKLLSDESALKNISQTRLIERLNKIQNKVAPESEGDVIGSRIKREIVEDIQDQDSLIRDVEIREEEPTVLDLVKILDEPGSKYDFIVKEGDVISIPSKLETVRIAGEVISPLNVRYDETFRFKNYINDAGGFTSTAKKGRSYVQYPNGRRKQTRRFLFFKFYPKVEPGSTIFVSRKPERQPLNFQAIIAAAGSVATLALVVDRLSN
ncbi:SLBB domain-containing protein [Roseivirga sp. UBA838]|uniref:SLBB domain-containing protein n=2 Tax=Roseivirga TaxID=290180 RepID=UPI00257DB2B9|nr:SLBB domain-containing protein [Roseivirga sp. UBA838]